MSANSAFAVQRPPSSAFEAEMERTIVASPKMSSSTAAAATAWDSSSSSSSPSHSTVASQRRPSASAVVTSAISDEEEEDEGNDWRDYSDYEEEEEETPLRTATPVIHSQSNPSFPASITTTRPSHLRSEQRQGLSTSKSTSFASSLSLTDLAQMTDVVGLSGGQWRHQLSATKQQLKDRRYSRGEQLTVERNSSFLHSNGETGTANPNLQSEVAPPSQGRLRSEAATSTERTPIRHRPLTSSDLPVLSPFERLTDVSPSTHLSPTFDTSLLPSTSRSALPPSHSVAAALKHSTFAKDREGMEQERRELLQEKRRILTAIALHEGELEGVREECERLDAAMMRLAQQKGMMRVREGTSSRFERRAQTEDGRLNPNLSTAQLVHALHTEIQQLKKDKEEKELQQDVRDARDARDAQDREEEESWIQTRERTGDEAQDVDVEVAFSGGRMSRRRRLLEMREKKRLLLERLHGMQDELHESRRGAAMDVTTQEKAASLARLEEELLRVQCENNEYQQQRRRAVERLESLGHTNAVLYQQIRDTRERGKSKKKRPPTAR